MERISIYIRQTLQDLYSPQEVKNLVMMIWCDMLGMDAIDIYLGKDSVLSESKRLELENILQRMLNNEPIQYIRGTANFLGRSFYVAPGVLIPRPETEELVELIVSKNQEEHPVILDIGTGSGCIAISLDLEIAGSKVVAWDVSGEALNIARRNNKFLSASVTFQQRDVFSELVEEDGVFDILVSNPPYITETERVEMEPNVLEWEPESALFVPDDDPLLFYRRIALHGLRLLKEGGKMYFEINRAYGMEIIRMLTEMGYHTPCVIKDISGNDRIVTAYK